MCVCVLCSRNGRWRSEWTTSFSPGNSVELKGLLRVQVHIWQCCRGHMRLYLMGKACALRVHVCILTCSWSYYCNVLTSSHFPLNQFRKCVNNMIKPTWKLVAQTASVRCQHWVCKCMVSAELTDISKNVVTLVLRPRYLQQWITYSTCNSLGNIKIQEELHGATRKMNQYLWPDLWKPTTLYLQPKLR